MMMLPWWCQWQRICLPVQERQEMQVQSLGQEDPLEEEMATHHLDTTERVCVVLINWGRKVVGRELWEELVFYYLQYLLPIGKLNLCILLWSILYLLLLLSLIFSILYFTLSIFYLLLPFIIFFFFPSNIFEIFFYLYSTRV